MQAIAAEGAWSVVAKAIWRTVVGSCGAFVDIRTDKAVPFVTTLACTDEAAWLVNALRLRVAVWIPCAFVDVCTIEAVAIKATFTVAKVGSKGVFA